MAKKDKKSEEKVDSKELKESAPKTSKPTPKELMKELLDGGINSEADAVKFVELGDFKPRNIYNGKEVTHLHITPDGQAFYDLFAARQYCKKQGVVKADGSRATIFSINLKKAK